MKKSRPISDRRLRSTIVAQSVELKELRKDVERLKETQYRRDIYTLEWKERFGYDERMSFDRVLEDLYKLKYGKAPY